MPTTSGLATKPLPDLSHLTTTPQLVAHILTALHLPSSTSSLHLTPSPQPLLTSSFYIATLAPTAIAASALAAAHYHSSPSLPSQISLDEKRTCTEFLCERLFALPPSPRSSPWGPLSGLHACRDGGWVRVHDGFAHHRRAVAALVGCADPAAAFTDTAELAEFKEKVRAWDALELEAAAQRAGAVVAALRSEREWDAHPAAAQVAAFPVLIRKVADSPPYKPPGGGGCLSGVRVLEASRVIAAPVAGKALASHGADVVWLQPPRGVPSMDELDLDTARGKRRVQADLRDGRDVAAVQALLRDADVFLQSYRPSALAARGLGLRDVLVLTKRGVVYASLSAYDTLAGESEYGVASGANPWARVRGYDSLVQAATGSNVAEAAAFGDATARVLPCQALDHAAGFLMAAGICAALARRASEGGSYEVRVSLVAVQRFLRSLGRVDVRLKDEGQAQREEGDKDKPLGEWRWEDVPEAWRERRRVWTREGERRDFVGLGPPVEVANTHVGWRDVGPPVRVGEEGAGWMKRDGD